MLNFVPVRRMIWDDQMIICLICFIADPTYDTCTIQYGTLITVMSASACAMYEKKRSYGLWSYYDQRTLPLLDINTPISSCSC